MQDYKSCSIEDFESAMKLKNADPKTLSDEQLYILYTKFHSDAMHCKYVGSTYSHGVGIDSEKHAQIYADELKLRNISV